MYVLGDVKSPRLVPKPHGATFSMQSPCLELGFSQPPVKTFPHWKTYNE